MRRSDRHPRTAATVAAAVLIFLATACGDGGGTHVTLTDLGRRLPKPVQDRGSLRVGSDIAYAPLEFFK